MRYTTIATERERHHSRSRSRSYTSSTSSDEATSSRRRTSPSSRPPRVRFADEVDPSIRYSSPRYGHGRSGHLADLSSAERALRDQREARARQEEAADIRRERGRSSTRIEIDLDDADDEDEFAPDLRPAYGTVKNWESRRRTTTVRVWTGGLDSSLWRSTWYGDDGLLLLSPRLRRSWTHVPAWSEQGGGHGPLAWRLRSPRY